MCTEIPSEVLEAKAEARTTASEERLHKLVGHWLPDVRLTALRNSNCPHEIRERVRDDENENTDVREAARRYAEDPPEPPPLM